MTDQLRDSGYLRALAESARSGRPSDDARELGPINVDEPNWPEPEPKQYALLHHAAAFARQCEAAGLPEAIAVRYFEDNVEDDGPFVQFDWGGPHSAVVFGNGKCNVSDGLEDDWDFRVGDPLPDALVTAIKATVV